MEPMMRLVVACPSFDCITIGRTHQQEQVNRTVTIMDSRINRIKLIHDLAVRNTHDLSFVFPLKPRRTQGVGIHLTTDIDGMLPFATFLIRHGDSISVVIDAVHAQLQYPHTVTTACSVPTLRTRSGMQRIDIGIYHTALDLRRNFGEFNLLMLLLIPDIFGTMTFPLIRSALTDTVYFLKLIGRVYREAVPYQTIASMYRLIRIWHIKHNRLLSFRHQIPGFFGWFQWRLGTIDHLVIEMQRVVLAHLARGSHYWLCINCIHSQTQCPYTITSFSRVQMVGIGE